MGNKQSKKHKYKDVDSFLKTAETYEIKAAKQMEDFVENNTDSIKEKLVCDKREETFLELCNVAKNNDDYKALNLYLSNLQIGIDYYLQHSSLKEPYKYTIILKDFIINTDIRRKRSFISMHQIIKNNLINEFMIVMNLICERMNTNIKNKIEINSDNNIDNKIENYDETNNNTDTSVNSNTYSSESNEDEDEKNYNMSHVINFSALFMYMITNDDENCLKLLKNDNTKQFLKQVFHLSLKLLCLACNKNCPCVALELYKIIACIIEINKDESEENKNLIKNKMN